MQHLLYLTIEKSQTPLHHEDFMSQSPIYLYHAGDLLLGSYSCSEDKLLPRDNMENSRTSDLSW